MRTEVVGRDKGLACGKSQTLGEINADSKSADKPGCVGHGKGVDIFKGNTGGLYRFIYHSDDGFGVSARGYLRHDSAVETVLLYLGGNNI